MVIYLIWYTHIYPTSPFFIETDASWRIRFHQVPALSFPKPSGTACHALAISCHPAVSCTASVVRFWHMRIARKHPWFGVPLDLRTASILRWLKGCSWSGGCPKLVNHTVPPTRPFRKENEKMIHWRNLGNLYPIFRQAHWRGGCVGVYGDGITKAQEKGWDHDANHNENSW